MNAEDSVQWSARGGALWLDITVVAGFLLATALVAAKTYPRAIL